MRENIEINNFLHRKRKMCEHIKNNEIIFRKYLTQTLFLIYAHVPVLERARGEHVDLR